MVIILYITNLDSPIKVKFSNFGEMPYGYYITGRIHYDLDNQDIDFACKPITTINIDNDKDFDPIIMVDRGNCTFVTKARNVQKLGGRLALIVDNKEEDINRIFMVDDGTGQDIYIQAVLISQKDGERIKKFIRENKNDQALLARLIIAIEYEIVLFLFI